MAVTYKGIPNRERWLQPSEKFKAKKVLLIVSIEKLAEPVLEQEKGTEPIVVDSNPIVNDVEPIETDSKPGIGKPKKRGRPKKRVVDKIQKTVKSEDVTVKVDTSKLKPDQDEDIWAV
ncbi:MAG: hypothetical protein H8E40_12630 [Chloroflexi bacterium]|nr:hypothetical protein [Chloroflexota bacterium]